MAPEDFAADANQHDTAENFGPFAQQRANVTPNHHAECGHHECRTANRQRSGQIVRLNDKTVTLISDGQKWRVAYALLHRVIDATTAEPIAGQIITR